MARKILAVFDFDHTIINGNSDTIIAKLLPQEVLKSDTFKEIRESQGWISYMSEVFKELPNYNIDKDKLKEICGSLEPNPGIIPLINHLRSNGTDVIILSDANDFIISTWLHSNGLGNIKIFTNPTTWVGNVLNLKPYHNQTICKQCSKNLCKGCVLKEYIETCGPHHAVLYIGDGQNDLCPSKILTQCDYVFPRKDFKLYKLLTQMQIPANVHPWCVGFDILNQIKIVLG